MKNITLDDLALMMQKGFLEQEEKFNARFSRLEERMDRLEQRMDKLEQRMDGLEQKVSVLEQRIEHIELQTDLIWGELRGTKDQLVAIDSRAEVATLKIRLDRTEKRLKTKSA